MDVAGGDGGSCDKLNSGHFEVVRFSMEWSLSIWCAFLSCHPTNIDYPPSFRNLECKDANQVAVSALKAFRVWWGWYTCSHHFPISYIQVFFTCSG